MKTLFLVFLSFFFIQNSVYGQKKNRPIKIRYAEISTEGKEIIQQLSSSTCACVIQNKPLFLDLTKRIKEELQKPNLQYSDLLRLLAETSGRASMKKCLDEQEKKYPELSQQLRKETNRLKEIPKAKNNTFRLLIPFQLIQFSLKKHCKSKEKFFNHFLKTVTRLMKKGFELEKKQNK